jgi:hypothetical protein
VRRRSLIEDIPGAAVTTRALKANTPIGLARSACGGTGERRGVGYIAELVAALLSATFRIRVLGVAGHALGGDDRFQNAASIARETYFFATGIHLPDAR